MYHSAESTTSLPALSLPPDAWATFDTGVAREWLVTNGLGGYAMGTVAGATTRCYHAYLIAAPRGPRERIALVTKIDEQVTLASGEQVALGADEYADGTVQPQGYQRLAAFALEGLLPIFTFDLGEGLTLEKRIWMEHGANLTFVRYRLIAEAGATAGPVALRLLPFLICRDHHASQRGDPAWRFAVASEPASAVVRAAPTADACRMTAGPLARFEPLGEWYWHVEHRAERARGLEDQEDVYLAGAFTVSLTAGETATLTLAVDDATGALPAGETLGGDDHERVADRALERERERQRALLAQADARDALSRRLTLAADQFIVAREATAPAATPAALAAGNPAVTVIAGYPWFTDWGRDTMIALPGLTLTTGRLAEARGLLRGFLAYMSQGMIPNRFPDNASDAPEYNTVDATLWLFHALDAYLTASGDWPLLDEVFDALDTSVTWHIRGTRYGIGVDAADGLLRAGAAGVQLTWMDAKVGDWVVTPRQGKPIEISALWYRALRLMSGWARRLARDASPYDGLAQEVAAHFADAYWYAEGGYFADVVDANGMAGARDTSLRPNQVLALAVAPELASAEQARSALAVVERELLIPLGLRTLSPDDPNFHGVYGGDQRARDGAYHQGTAWPWLLGVYADARARAFPEEDAAATRARLLAPLVAHLPIAGVGSISEIAWGATPFTPDGCPAQAWSVAETLRLARMTVG